MTEFQANLKVSQKVKVPVLTYHSIDESNSVISTAPEVFRQQMKSLSAAGYTAVSMSCLIDSLNRKNQILPKTIVLTFDDGFQNFYTEAFPILEQYDFNATVFLVTDFCGKNNDWAGNLPELSTQKLLSWKEVKKLNEYGIEFGAHTRTHPDLTRISAAAAERETAESKAIIEDVLGTAVNSFAYPYGKFNDSVKKIAERNYQSACSTNLGKVKTTSDFFSLERIDTYYLSNPKIFDSLSTKTFNNYLRIRQSLRTVKSIISRN